MAELEAYEKNMHTGMKWKVTTNLANTTVKNTPCSVMEQWFWPAPVLKAENQV